VRANDGANSLTTLSNGWAPHFDGKAACSISFSYTQCGGHVRRGRRAFANPLGPFEKAGGPILKTNATWGVGPGHCSVLDTPEVDTYIVYHAWPLAHDARVTLVDAVHWGDQRV
jgi:hypothetical protein